MAGGGNAIMETESKMTKPEIDAARAMFADAIFAIEADGRCVATFASAALLAASELYAEAHGPDALRRAFMAISQAEIAASARQGGLDNVTGGKHIPNTGSLGETRSFWPLAEGPLDHRAAFRTPAE
ncbi:MAG: hypothetical protein JKP98_02525 [Rhodobacteraceae bacterium]|nr:hypothetical protein [Paracoccaceae bacterium]